MRRTTGFEAIIFDMDGVIVNSEPRHERAVLDIIREIGFADKHGMRISDYVGRSDREVWKDFIQRIQPPQSLEELLALKRRRTIEILRQEQPLFNGAVQLLKRLEGRCPLGLASGSERAIVEAVLEFQNLRRFFSAVVTCSEVPCGKPAPDIFLITAEQLRVRPEQCWVIEDSKPGVAAALAAGMRVIAITNTHPAEELGHATNVVRDYSEIDDLLL
jgi:HAD superfamily hydrolase (TIGR01509 family)